MTGTQYFLNRIEHGRARKAKKQNMKQMMERRKTKKGLDEYQFSFKMQPSSLESSKGETSNNTNLGLVMSPAQEKVVSTGADLSESKALVTIKPLKTSKDNGTTFFANRLEHGLVRKMKKQNMREMIERRKAKKETNEKQLSPEKALIISESKPRKNGCGLVGNAATAGMCSKCHLKLSKTRTSGLVDKPCKNGCGLVGNAVTGGMCSKCHLEFLKAPTCDLGGKPCKNACGLSGNTATGGMCTKCHRESLKKESTSNEKEADGANFFYNRMDHGHAREMKKQKMKKMMERKKLRAEMKQQESSLQVLKSSLEEQSASLQLLKDFMPAAGNAILPAAEPSALALTNGEQISTTVESQALVEIQKPKMTSSELATGMEQQTQLLQQILSKFNQIESKMDQMDSKINQLTNNQDAMASSLKSLEAGSGEESNKKLLALTNSTNMGTLVEHWSSPLSTSTQTTHVTPDIPRVMPSSMSQLLMEHEILYKLNEYANPSTRKHWPAALKASYSKRKFMYSRILARAKQMRGKSADFTTAKNKAAESFDMEMHERGCTNTDEYFKFMKNYDIFARNNGGI